MLSSRVGSAQAARKAARRWVATTVHLPIENGRFVLRESSERAFLSDLHRVLTVPDALPVVVPPELLDEFLRGALLDQADTRRAIVGPWVVRLESLDIAGALLALAALVSAAVTGAPQDRALAVASALQAASSMLRMLGPRERSVVIAIRALAHSTGKAPRAGDVSAFLGKHFATPETLKALLLQLATKGAIDWSGRESGPIRVRNW